MKPHYIKQTFKGTQDGQHDCHEFIAGTTEPLSKGLAAIVVKEGWAELATPKHEPISSEVETVFHNDEPVKAEDRETKVIVPEETKPTAHVNKKKR